MKTATATRHNGETVTATVGRFISFKMDIEQSAKVKEIAFGGPYGNTAKVRVDVSEGEYRGKNVWINLSDCWND